MSVCKACNNVMTSAENKRRIPTTREFEDLCESCKGTRFKFDDYNPDYCMGSSTQAELLMQCKEITNNQNKEVY